MSLWWKMMVKLRHKDYYCVNIYCDNPLTQYELKRQTAWRYRFCNKCRRMITAGRGKIAWNCLGCGDEITTGSVIGMYFCGNKCKEKGRIKRMLINYRMRKVIKNIRDQGGIDKYKCKISI